MARVRLDFQVDASHVGNEVRALAEPFTAHRAPVRSHFAVDGVEVPLALVQCRKNFIAGDTFSC